MNKLSNRTKGHSANTPIFYHPTHRNIRFSSCSLKMPAKAAFKSWHEVDHDDWPDNSHALGKSNKL
jgi:hypothetical protein